MSSELYVDGGVIARNPSPIGGTWAVRLIENGQVCQERSGIIIPQDAGLPEITNNLTEMLALLRGLECLPDSWIGVIFSDSQVTLGRVFDGWKWQNIPLWMHHQFQAQRRRLVYWDRIGHVLLDGHPTKAQLAAGIGKRGHLVSEHNIWCDWACGQQAKQYLASLQVTE
jgi:ribonuclease HI